MAKIIKATEVEKREYDRIKYRVHPLFGWVTACGVKLPVEYLGEGKGNPNWEALAPEGFHFAVNGVHTLLGTTQKDLLGRLSYEELAACSEAC